MPGFKCDTCAVLKRTKRKERMSGYRKETTSRRVGEGGHVLNLIRNQVSEVFASCPVFELGSTNFKDTGAVDYET